MSTSTIQTPRLTATSRLLAFEYSRVPAHASCLRDLSRERNVNAPRKLSNQILLSTLLLHTDEEACFLLAKTRY